MGLLTLFARRFVAGEDLADAVRATSELNKNGVLATIDILGENVRSREAAESLRDSYIGLYDAIAAGGLKANVSLKLTMMGLDIDDAFCRDNVAGIVSSAAGRFGFVKIDMEGSAYTQRTLDIFYSLYRQYPGRVGIVLQSSLYRTDRDVEDAIAAGCRVRICKGAYKEPESVAYPKKDDVNAAYVRHMKRLLESGNYPGIATHDANIIGEAKRFAAERRIGSDRFEFQMLYGIRRDLQGRLVKDGYNMRVYVPFGTAWFPYFYRRLRERKENIYFILRHLISG